jgi:hypothetical protein
MKEKIIFKVIAALGGAAALFYALGYAVVQSYVYKNGFDGILWFTSEFYRHAGASFVLDLIRVPMLAPYIFFLYLFLLYLLIPNKEKILRLDYNNVIIPKEHKLKIAVLIVILVVTGAILLYYERILGIKFVTELIDLLRRSAEHTSTQPEQSLAFFCLVTPITAILAIFLIMHWKSLKSDLKSQRLYIGILAVYFTFLSIIPITYGFYLYNLKTVPIKDARLVRCISDQVKDSPDNAEIWFLGEFSNRYVFFKRSRNELKNQGIIEVYDAQEIKHLNFDVQQSSTLKVLMKGHIPDDLKKDTVDLILDDFKGVKK